MSIQIHGEYRCVARGTKHPELLDRLHGTGITPDAAADLTRYIVDKFDTCIGLIKFEYRHCGRFMWKTRNIILPAQPLTDPQSRYGRLRVGIVVHEVAHAIAFDRGCRTHAPAFIEVLDSVMECLTEGGMV